MTDPIALLRACQVASGLSVPRYAEERLGRSARCVNYWLAGERDIPPRMVAFLERSAEYPRAMELMAHPAVPRMAWGCLRCGYINDRVGQMQCTVCGTPYNTPPTPTEEPKP